jgi:hypothetical protein
LKEARFRKKTNTWPTLSARIRPESITLEGTRDFNSGNETGSVSAASNTQHSHIGKQYTRTGATDLVHIG